LSRSLIAKFQPLYERIHNNIFELCRAYNFYPTPQQEKILKKVQYEHSLPYDKRKKRIAIKSGQGPGKTTIMALIMQWRCLRFIGAMGVVTAPTLRQAREVFLAESRRLLERADPIIQYLVKITKSKIIIGDRPKWGVECATAIKAENLQGYHQERMTFVVDEASGVARPIIEQMLGTLTNEDSLCIQIGNPNTRDCAFYDCFHRWRHLWHTFTMNAEESPIVDQENVRRLREQFGRNSDVYRVRVLGEFPNLDPSAIMSSDDLEACTLNDPYKAALEGGLKKQFGIDFARYGSDESVIYQRSGYAIVAHEIFVKQDPNDVVSRAFVMQREFTWENEETDYIADAGGMGQGVMINFHRAGKRILEFHNNGVSCDLQYENKITEAFFLLRDLVRIRKIYIPNDPVLIQQLSTRQYLVSKRTGKIVVESKEDYMKRTTLPSPDRADALVMAFYTGAYAQSTMTQKSREGSGKKAVGIEMFKM
jgi:hypothetical protein